MAIATFTDVFRHAPYGVLVAERRRVVAVDSGADVFTLPAHGFGTDERLRFVAEGNSTLPAPLSATAAYYAVPSTELTDLFSVSTTAGGSALDITDSGTGRFSVVADIRDAIEAAIILAEGKVRLQLDAHDWDSVVADHSDFLVAYIAKIAAREVMTQLGKDTEVLSASIEKDLGDVRMAVKDGAFLDTENGKSTSRNVSLYWDDGALPFDGAGGVIP